MSTTSIFKAEQLTQKVPSKESQGNHSFSGHVKQIDSVKDLVLGHLAGIKEWKAEDRGSQNFPFPKGTMYTLSGPHSKKTLKRALPEP